MSFVKAAESRIGNIWRTVKRVGNSIIGGDFSGGARGIYALDFQVLRNTVAQVASGHSAIAIGNNNEASATQSVTVGGGNIARGGFALAVGQNNLAEALSSFAVGQGCWARGEQSVAVGYISDANGQDGIALGAYANVGADRGIAIGLAARALRAKTCHIASLHVIPAWSASFSDECQSSAPEIVIMSRVYDLSQVADYVVTLPAGVHFWLSEIGLICTALNALVTQPTIRFGISGTPAKHLAATLTTLLTAQYKREKWSPLVPGDGETSLSAGVTVAANVGEMEGRFYWKGILVEDG